MEGPALKRPKLQLGDVKREDWLRWSNNLEKLQSNLVSTGCLCCIEKLELQRPILPSGSEQALGPNVVDNQFLKDYTLQFISTINLLSDTALKQQAKGFICKKIMDMASDVAMDEGIWEMLIEYLDSADKFITFATSKGLISLLMWTKLPNLNEIFDELFKSVTVTTNNPIKLSHILEIIQGVVEYKDEAEHPLDLEEDEVQNPADVGLSNSDRLSSDEDFNMAEESERTNLDSVHNSRDNNHSLHISQKCLKVEVDTEIESEVKNLCVKALEIWWNRLLAKFQNMMASYDEVNEAPILTFLSLWLSIISVKNNLSVIDTKHYYMHLEAFVPLLNPNSPAVIWKNLTDIFNEILCYGSTLSLQDIPNDEPCDLAHLIIRCVKSQQFLPGVPYSRNFTGFGGSFIGPVDWEWESTKPQNAVTTYDSSHGSRISSNLSSSSSHSQPAIPSSSKSCVLPRQNLPLASSSTSSSNYKSSSFLPHSFSKGSQDSVPGPYVPLQSKSNELASSSKSVATRPNATPLKITSTIYVGPSPDAVRLDKSYDERGGDRPLLQKIVLLVLKSVAVTVKETRCDDSDSGNDDSSREGSENSGSENDTNDMLIIEREIREVCKHLDAFVKSLQPYHPETPMGEWIVKLFADQDDALVESMLCALDTYTGFMGRIVTPPDFHRSLNPVLTFVAFLNAVSHDKDILLDWLMGNETCFLLYLLRFLKFSFKNWPDFVSSCGRDLDKTMSLLIRLRMGVGRLVERSLFPYNINPVLRLLERCEELYETNGGNNS